MYIIYNEEGPNSNELGPFSYYLLHTAYISAIYQHKICIYHYFNTQKVEQRLNNRFKLKQILKRSHLYFSDRIVESKEFDKL